jgi:hypothetical protein
MWPQYWCLYEPRGPAKGPKGVSPPHQIKKVYKNVVYLNYLRPSMLNQNFILNEVKNKLNFGNICCSLDLDSYSSHLLSENDKIINYTDCKFTSYLIRS